MEIERQCLSDEASEAAWRWWEKWFADREERLKYANERRPASAQPRAYLPIPEQRHRYLLGPNGELTKAA